MFGGVDLTGLAHLSVEEHGLEDPSQPTHKRIRENRGEDGDRQIWDDDVEILHCHGDDSKSHGYRKNSQHHLRDDEESVEKADHERGDTRHCLTFPYI